MQQNDLIAEAEVRVHFGCHGEAIALLVQSQKIDFSEAELTVKKLDVLKRLRLQENRGGIAFFVGIVHLLLVFLAATITGLAFGFGVQVALIPALQI